MVAVASSRRFRCHKKRAGTEPFRQLRKHGVLPLGGAAMTGAGRMTFKGIIHVAGIGHDWLPNEHSVRQSTANALALAKKHGVRSIAFPLIGTGTGGLPAEKVLAWMLEEIERSSFDGETIIVRLKR